MSGISEFAAYFRQLIPEVRGKSKIRRPDPGFKHPRTAVLLPKTRLRSEVYDFSPHFRENRQTKGRKTENATKLLSRTAP